MTHAIAKTSDTYGCDVVTGIPDNEKIANADNYAVSHGLNCPTLFSYADDLGPASALRPKSTGIPTARA